MRTFAAVSLLCLAMTALVACQGAEAEPSPTATPQATSRPSTPDALATMTEDAARQQRSRERVDELIRECRASGRCDDDDEAGPPPPVYYDDDAVVPIEPRERPDYAATWEADRQQREEEQRLDEIQDTLDEIQDYQRCRDMWGESGIC